MFQKARQNRVFQDVVDQIQDAILEGKIKEGDKLPPERELKETFNISRGTLREALRVLEQKGLIEIRLGVSGGAIVKSITSEGTSQSLSLLIRSQSVGLDHLAEFRVGLEADIVGLACKRATPSDIVKLDQILDTAKNYLSESNWDEFIRADEKFHLTLADISRNPLYQTIQKAIQDNIHKYYEKYLSKEGSILSENFTHLCEIVEAIKAGSPEKASEKMKEHVGKFGTHMNNKN